MSVLQVRVGRFMGRYTLQSINLLPGMGYMQRAYKSITRGLGSCPIHLLHVPCVLTLFFFFEMRGLLSTFAVLVGLVLVVNSLPTKLHDRDGATQTILTLCAGPITGLKLSGIYKFLGIPYALAPTGSRRFAAPSAYPAAGLMSPYSLFARSF
jgi:hypothetical protein